MQTSEEAGQLWKALETGKERILGQSLRTKGLHGGGGKKTFIPSSLEGDRLYLQVEGRSKPPKYPTFIKQADLELYLGFQRREISSDQAKKSFRTSYAGPLIDSIRKLSASDGRGDAI